MITTTRMQNEKQRLSAEAAESFSTRNATAGHVPAVFALN